MTQIESIKIFEAKQVRTLWNKLKQRLKEGGNQMVTNCHQLKMQAVDGKLRLTDVADTQQLFRLIQSVPSYQRQDFMQMVSSAI